MRSTSGLFRQLASLERRHGGESSAQGMPRAIAELIVKLRRGDRRNARDLSVSDRDIEEYLGGTRILPPGQRLDLVLCKPLPPKIKALIAKIVQPSGRGGFDLADPNLPGIHCAALDSDESE